MTGVTSTAAELNLLDALDRGSILYGNASGATAVLGQGSNGYVLTSDGTDISWAASSVSGLAADNLTIGDAAILLTTSSGNITVDAAANDSDIIFKGTDGTVDTTYTVNGLTQEHINKWGWRVNTKGWVNFPDYQWRIYRNNAKIKWVNKVHEVLTGYETHADLPPNKEWCLLHPKDIERQEKQNSYYETLQ